MRRIVAVNDAGLRIGEDHHNAKLTDAEVERIRSLHYVDGLGYKTLAAKYEISQWTVGRYCRFELRAQTPTAYREVHVADES